MKNQNYLKNYFQNFKRLITFTEIELKKINIIKNLLLEIKKKEKRYYFLGMVAVQQFVIMRLTILAKT